MTKDETLQLALEALEINLVFLRKVKPFKGQEDLASDCVAMTKETITAIKKALETKDEPVAWGMEKDGVILDVICPAEHEREEGGYTVPLYTTPQRTWVKLTDEDMNNALDYWSDNSRSAYGGAHAANGEYVDMIETWRYIEAKLKEKNT